MAGERVPEPDRARLDAATADLEPPFALVDLDAFDANAADLLRRAGGKAAAAGLEVGALPRAAGTARWPPGFRGQLCFTLPEALWLAGPRRWRPARRLPDGRPGPRCARWRTGRTRGRSP